MERQQDPLEPRLAGGPLNAAISEAVVRITSEATGRGPTRARTTVDGDLVVVLLHDALTSGERFLADHDGTEQVLDVRRAYQRAMGGDCVARIQALTGRKVMAFMSANHVEPDLAAEIFVLEPE